MYGVLNMTIKSKRYEFEFDEQINGGGKENLKGFVFDVCPEGSEPMTEKGMCIILQSEDKGTEKEEIGHTPYGYLKFVDATHFELAQMALEIFQKAVFLDNEMTYSQNKSP